MIVVLFLTKYAVPRRQNNLPTVFIRVSFEENATHSTAGAVAVSKVIEKCAKYTDLVHWM